MKRVLLCGNSLFVSGLQASLEIASELELQMIEPQMDRIYERVKTWKPEVLILETGLLKETFSLSLLNDYPEIRLISLDLDDNRLLVLSGSTSEQPTTEGLLQVIAA
ncbi:MAG: hypothetical protein JW750_11940 [Anaerolineaceae bacterium]|nr:hypothetical protein [Anaerolineaceae bacterium]